MNIGDELKLRSCVVVMARNDDTGFQQVLERADYLAKEYTKAHCTGERNFGCSRS
ncbi:inovirus Gp2 family protein [Escherichia coli]|nr:inovirus Gp2 family protein [Escherichia coli]OKU10731.1 hypothetical protein ACN74_01680 [Escherichia coli]